ncbi:MAG: IS66 family insertion sequence element accessory protein TnpB [Candidatus Obscuribacterales bacterium]|nr:IS66 family insertion sequence element accessory protein TnpB [Candidatus Obscuribacterales bacterium]
MRKSFSSLCGVVRSCMNLDPFTGSLFVFKNKRADKIKLLYFDRDGLATWYKVLQKGTFRFPDLSNISSAGVEIDASTLRLILDGIDLRSINRQQRYRINQQGQIEHLVPQEAEPEEEAQRAL